MTGDHGRRVALEWHVLVGPDNALTAAVGGGYEATVEQMEPFGTDKFEWRIARSPSAVDVHAPGFTNAVFRPIAEGRAATLGAGVAAAEAAVLRLSKAEAMSPDEAAAYLEAHPDFAARVAAHARQLAAERGLIPPTAPSGPGSAAPSSGSLGPAGRAFPEGAFPLDAPSLPPSVGGVGGPAPAPSRRR